MQIYYSYSTEFEHYGNLKTNVVVASFVTTYGRLKLYSLLNSLGKRVLYCDTDSVIYTQKEGESKLELGDYLGDLTNELDTDRYIVEFVSGGPKNYAFKLYNGETKCTVKGFTQNCSTIEKINFDSIKNIVCNNRDERIVVPQLKFSRDNKLWQVRTDDIQKSYGLVYDKRFELDSLTFPLDRKSVV
jgi:hypothetical protein